MDSLIDLPAISGAFAILSTELRPWLLVIPGILIGLVAGAIPGFSPAAALAIVLPVSYHLDFLSSMIFMTAIFTGGGFGVAIPSILINVPGSPASVATCFDGFPMTQQGRHNEALGIALATSAFAMALGYVILLLFVNVVAVAVLALGPAEYLIILVSGMSLIALMGGNLLRGLFAGIVGVLLATIGFSLMGTARGTLGLPHLLDGVALVPAMVGLFAGAEMFNLMRHDYVVKNEAGRELSTRRIMAGAVLPFRYPGILMKDSMIGALIGMLPGVGASLANLVSYHVTKLGDANPQEFGKGSPKGVIAAESANSSSEGGSMLTLLALGIPSSAGTAMLFAVFSINNITGGPRFYTENKDIVFAIILNNIAQAFILVIIGIFLIRYFAMLVKTPTKLLVPTVFAISLLSTYVVMGDMSGPITALVFAIVGWIMHRYDYSRPAMVVGLLLGKQLEEEALRTFQISGGSIQYLLGRPIALILLLILVLCFLVPLLRTMMRKNRRAKAEGPENVL